jgi:hypothetical protein
MTTPGGAGTTPRTVFDNSFVLASSASLIGSELLHCSHCGAPTFILALAALFHSSFPFLLGAAFALPHPNTLSPPSWYAFRKRLPIIGEMTDEKPRRGRPRKYDFEEHAEALRNITHAKSDRGKQDAILALRAAAAIEGIVNSEEAVLEERVLLDPVLREGRPSVFTELGRLVKENPTEEDTEEFFAALFLVAMHRDKSAKTLIRMLRRNRLGDGGVDAVDALTYAISRVLDQYRERYPDLTLDDLEAALQQNIRACQIARDSQAPS